MSKKSILSPQQFQELVADIRKKQKPLQSVKGVTLRFAKPGSTEQENVLHLKPSTAASNFETIVEEDVLFSDPVDEQDLTLGLCTFLYFDQLTNKSASFAEYMFAYMKKQFSEIHRELSAMKFRQKQILKTNAAILEMGRNYHLEREVVEVEKEAVDPTTNPPFIKSVSLVNPKSPHFVNWPLKSLEEMEKLQENIDDPTYRQQLVINTLHKLSSDDSNSFFVFQLDYFKQRRGYDEKSRSVVFRKLFHDSLISHFSRKGNEWTKSAVSDPVMTVLKGMLWTGC